MHSKYLTAILMILVAAFSRILPHPPNFNPVLAISLFSGAYLLDKRLAFLIPLLGMLLSDLVIGFHDLLPVVYALMALFVYFGTRLSRSISVAKTAGTALVSSILFFGITNFAVWLTSGMYSLDLSGLSLCFSMALPFFQNSILGDFVYTGILFGSMAVLEKTAFQNLVPVRSK